MSKTANNGCLDNAASQPPRNPPSTRFELTLAQKLLLGRGFVIPTFLQNYRSSANVSDLLDCVFSECKFALLLLSSFGQLIDSLTASRPCPAHFQLLRIWIANLKHVSYFPGGRLSPLFTVWRMLIQRQCGVQHVSYRFDVDMLQPTTWLIAFTLMTDSRTLLRIIWVSPVMKLMRWSPRSLSDSSWYFFTSLTAA